MPTSVPHLSFLTLNFRDKDGVTKINVGSGDSTLPYRVRWN